MYYFCRCRYFDCLVVGISVVAFENGVEYETEGDREEE